ncbi:MAG: DNA-directed RNA polymerase subunit alpha [Chloroflexota bacterium]|nr:DNA-directed RNA polymerase subunit alpha [Chloroflexota bacterium]
MSKMVTPKIEQEAESRNYGKYAISPLERGYGLTLGNALRRVLLSSLEGAAVTSVRITGIQHEFSSIPGVREDVIRVMMQIKKLHVKLYDVDSTRMYLEVGGSGVVTAADIIPPSDVEIVNPDLYICTVDDRDEPLEIEMTVQRGRGYSSSADDRTSRLPIGELPIDAIFNPVKRVNYDVGFARVGQSTNYDKLTIEIWTDGTTAPEKALSTSARLMMEHLQYLAGVTAESLAAMEEVVEEEVEDEIIETPIEDLDLSVRVFNSLKRAGISHIGEILDLMEKGDDAVMSIRNFGIKSLQELKLNMVNKNYLDDETEEDDESE